MPKKLDIKELIRECIMEVYSENNVNIVDTPTQGEEEDDFLQIMKGDDPTVVGGFNYHLMECGIDTKMGYDNGRHTLLVRRDDLPMTIDTLINTGDELGEQIGRVLEKKHFNKPDEKINNGQKQN
jgi:hypothetical protein